MKYELSHDSIAKQLFEKASSGTRERRKIKREIKEAYIAYIQREAKLTQEDVSYFKPYLNKVNITAEEKMFVEYAERRISRRRKQIIGIISFVILALASLLAWAFLELDEQIKQRDRADLAERNLEVAMASALRSDSLAQIRANQLEIALRQAEISDSLTRNQFDNAPDAKINRQ